MFGVCDQDLAKLRYGALTVARPSARPAGAQQAKSHVQRKTVRPAQFEESLGCVRGDRGVATKHLEHSFELVDVRLGRDMRGFDRACDRFLHQLPRPSDIAEQPICLSEVSRRGGAGILNEANLSGAITLAIV